MTIEFTNLTEQSNSRRGTDRAPVVALLRDLADRIEQSQSIDGCGFADAVDTEHKEFSGDETDAVQRTITLRWSK